MGQSYRNLRFRFKRCNETILRSESVKNRGLSGLDWKRVELLLKLPMDEMRQVSRTVATVALLLLILPHALRSDDEGQQIDRNMEISMHQMASKLEKNLGVSLDETNYISKAFAKMAEYVKKNAIKYRSHEDGNSFGIYFEFPRKKNKWSDKTSFFMG